MITAELETALRPMCNCGRPACMVAIRHLTDYCKGPGTTPSGGSIWILCMSCVQELAEATQELIEEKLDGLTEGFTLICQTCDKRITSLSDVLELEVL